MDDRLRGLERAAATGDDDARRRLIAERRRLGYQVPQKVDERIRENQQEARQRLASESGCGFYEPQEVSLSYGKQTQWASGMSATTPLPQDGCWLLQDPICYMRRGTKRQPKVSCKEQCPLYQRAEAVLRDLQTE